MAPRSKSVTTRPAGHKPDRSRPAGADAAPQVRAGSAAGWPDDDSGLWTDDGHAEASRDFVEMTAKPGITPGARRRLEQYWEDRRLEDALKDAFDE